MPNVSVKCAHCAELNHKNCVSVLWEVMERTITSKCKKIKENKWLVDNNNEKKTIMKTQLHAIKNQKFLQKCRIRHNKKVLKQAKNHITAQTKCLTKKLNLKSTKAYKSTWEDTFWEFGPKLSELFAQNFVLLHTTIENESPMHFNTCNVSSRLIFFFFLFFFCYKCLLFSDNSLN